MSYFKPFIHQETRPGFFNCPGLKSFEEQAREVNHKEINLYTSDYPRLRKYYAIKVKSNSSLFYLKPRLLRMLMIAYLH